MKTCQEETATAYLHLGYIDGLRAVAVLAVVSYHAALVGNASAPRWMLAGARGVDLFFVLSGFCLAYPFLVKSLTTRAIGLGVRGFFSFLLRRFSRIAPPYYAALAMFALLALTPFGIPSANVRAVAAGTMAHEFVNNLFFLNSGAPLFNSSFWTLGIEARWYLLCPPLIALFVRSRVAFYVLGTALYALYWLSPYGISDEGTLPCFMLGIVAADVAIRNPRPKRWVSLSAVALFAGAMLEQSRLAMVDHGDPLWQAACFAIVVAAASGIARDILAWRPIVAIGVASYSIYLVHEPVIAGLARLGVPHPLAGCASVACGLLAYVAIERPLSNAAVRYRIETVLSSPFQGLRKSAVGEKRYAGPVR